MSVETEIEVTYLAAALPTSLKEHPYVQMRDVYFPASAAHAKTRIRQKDNKYEFTKKIQTGDDAGIQEEHNVSLSREEFEALATGAGRELVKKRYLMPYQGLTAEIDIFEGPLEGLVVIEFEFKTAEQKAAFTMPEFCLADVTQDDVIAGGVLAGKAYADIQDRLATYRYVPLQLT